MKRHLILTILLAIGLYSWAAPLKNIEVRITQPNGQIINCFASGDEYYNYLHDANGFTIVKGEDDDRLRVSNIRKHCALHHLWPAAVGSGTDRMVDGEESPSARQGGRLAERRPCPTHRPPHISPGGGDDGSNLATR